MTIFTGMLYFELFWYLQQKLVRPMNPIRVDKYNLDF